MEGMEKTWEKSKVKTSTRGYATWLRNWKLRIGVS